MIWCKELYAQKKFKEIIYLWRSLIKFSTFFFSLKHHPRNQSFFVACNKNNSLKNVFAQFETFIRYDFSKVEDFFYLLDIFV